MSAPAVAPLPAQQPRRPRSVEQGDTGIQIKYHSGCSGCRPDVGDRVRVQVIGRTFDGQVFWARGNFAGSAPLWFTVGDGEVPKGLDRGVRKVSLAQRASLLCSPSYAVHPLGAAAVPPGVPVVFEVEVLEIVSWSQIGREVCRMRSVGPNSCVSTVAPCPCGVCSLATLFPDDPNPAACSER